MSQHMGCTPAGACDRSPSHRFFDNDRDSAMISEASEGSSGANKQCLVIALRPSVLQIIHNCLADLLG